MDELSIADRATVEAVRAQIAAAPDPRAFAEDVLKQPLDEWRRAHVALGLFIEDAAAGRVGEATDAYGRFVMHCRGADRGSHLAALAAQDFNATVTPDRAVAESWRRYEAEFRRCWPWLEAGLDTHPIHTHDKGQIWSAIRAGTTELWPLPNSAILTEITEYATGVKALYILVAGGKLNEITEKVAWLEDYARERGCRWIVPQGRFGWLRALDGYRKISTVMAKELV